MKACQGILQGKPSHASHDYAHRLARRVEWPHASLEKPKGATANKATPGAPQAVQGSCGRERAPCSRRSASASAVARDGVITSTSSTSRSSTLGKCGCRRRRVPRGPCVGSPCGPPAGAPAAAPAGPAVPIRCAPRPAGAALSGAPPPEQQAAAPPAPLQSAASCMTQGAGAARQGAWPQAQTLPGVGGSGPARVFTLVTGLSERRHKRRTLSRRRGSAPAASPASAVTFK